MYSGNYARDGWFNLVKTGGLFSKFTCERVTSNPRRKSGDGRLGSVLGKEEKGGPAGIVTPATSSMAGGVEVTGARG